MKENKIYLYDDIGNQFERKNLFLKEYYTLKEKASRKDADALKALKKSKKSHAYMVKLNGFKSDEKKFLKVLGEKRTKVKSTLDKKEPRKLQNLRVQLALSKEKVAFYKKYIGLDYRAQLEYELSVLLTEQLPDIIENYALTFENYQKAKVAFKHIDNSKQTKSTALYRQEKVKQDALYKESLEKLKEKRRQGSISAKALKGGIEELKIKRKEHLKVLSYNIEKNGYKEALKSYKYQLSKGVNRQIKVLNSNCSDIRKKIPIEVEQSVAWHAPVTALVPGLGQLLNKQYFKAIFFLLGAAFIYFIAWPYAFGYGNYQGDGIAGLISLAEGGKRIHKSLIFMIEGIVAIFLLLIALGIYIVSFKDVRKVEKKMIRGIRPNNKFESLIALEVEGFPYMVSAPALIITLFVVLVPISTTILLSFTGMDPQHQSKFPWVGLDNYMMLIKGQGLAGSVFYSILLWTLIWTICATTLAILLGFFLALMVNNDRIKGKAFFRAVYLLPWAVPAFITIMFFSIMFSPNGALTGIMETLFGTKILIKNSTFLSRVTLIGLQAWLGSSYVFLLSTGVLQAIPEDLYEAAQIDGATAWQRLRKITLPLVLFQTAPLLVGQYTFNFNNFSIIYLFNSGGPFNPTKYGNLAGSTDLLISYIFKLTTENSYQAIGAAITIVISLGLMIFAFIGFKNSKAFKEERL